MYPLNYFLFITFSMTLYVDLETGIIFQGQFQDFLMGGGGGAKTLCERITHNA